MKTDSNSKKTYLKAIFISLSIFVMSISFFFIGYYISKANNKISDEDQKVIDTYHLLKEEWLYGNELNNFTDEALSSLIEGVASKENDAYTFYTDTQAGQNLSLVGTGFGFSSHYYDGNLYVTKVVSGPVENLLQEKDIILSITVNNDDSFILKEHTLSEIQSFISKERPLDTDYTFSILRGNEKKEFTVKKRIYRENGLKLIQSPNQDNDYTTIIKISTFLDISLTNNVYSTLKDFSIINNLIIDLTDNGGGYVDQASSLAKLFVKKNTLIYKMINNKDEVIQESYQSSDPSFDIANYKIIINSSSASASELFTLAMRKGTNAMIVGLKSYGKGIAQSFKTFSDGSVIRYTSSLVYGPKRDNETMSVLSIYDKEDIFSIHKVGITPDDLFEDDFTIFNKTFDLNNLKYPSSTQIDDITYILKNIYPDKFTDISSLRYDDVIRRYTTILNEKYSLSLEAFDDNSCVSKEVSNYFSKESYDTYLHYREKMLNLYYYGI